MSLKEDLETSVAKIFKDQWTTRDGTVVPESDDLKLGNDAVLLDATVLYADLASSTAMVDRKSKFLAAEVYKTFLHCAAKIVRAGGGAITAYDGDRIMAVFLGDSKNTSAVGTGLKINWAVKKVINPALKNQYPDANHTVKHTVGIDTGELWVARTGIRGSNDLVWVGRAANYAAKLNDLTPDYPTRITHRVFDNMHKSVKISSDGRDMWESRRWTDMNNLSIYRSSFWRPLP
jgi:class 3 adenylate cyclase